MCQMLKKLFPIIEFVQTSGGLRRALALALALGIPDSLPYRQEILTVTFGVVAFSVFVQGITMIPLLRRLGQIARRPNAAPAGS